MSLRGSDRPLTELYDAALLDLDGVVYVGGQPVAHAADAVAAARRSGMLVAFVTNNASRLPAEVANRLTALGVEASAADVVTSAQAAAHLLADRLPASAAVLVTGTQALRDVVAAAGLHPVASADDRPAAVVQGYASDLGYAELAEATLAIRAGALWIATNCDSTMPSPRGLLPGNGALVAAVAAATGREPEVAGKPRLPLHREAVRRTGAQRPLVVGDRLDTDIEGAVAAATPSLLVLTGVTTPSELLGAPARARPTYIAADLRGLLAAHPEVTVDGDEARCGDWVAAIRDGYVEVSAQVAPDGAVPRGCGAADGQPSIDARPGSELDGLRAAAAACWAASDRSLTVREARFDGAAGRKQAGSTDTASAQTTIPVHSAR